VAKDDFYFFWSGPFSQWAIRPMTISGVEYNCCEQYMMASKAAIFADNWAYDEIMKEKDPSKQKALGRQVKHFDKDIWDDACRGVVYLGNYYKFTQHEPLKKMLELTGDKIIVEASPYDRVWGIGLSASDPRALDRAQWRGTNWLGEAIMEVRLALREKSIIK
jgi:ribA/ribD-fused uncharacterized protein